MKKFVITVLIILVVLVIWLVVKSDKVATYTPPENTGGVSGQFARLEENAIYVPDQPLGDEVLVKIANLKDPGFVIIHKDNAGSPGAIIGVSRWLNSGEHTDLSIGTTEALADGLQYYAMIHKDDGNGIFDPSNDVTVTSQVNAGEPIMMMFMADIDAPNPKDIQVNF